MSGLVIRGLAGWVAICCRSSLAHGVRMLDGGIPRREVHDSQLILGGTRSHQFSPPVPVEVRDRKSDGTGTCPNRSASEGLSMENGHLAAFPGSDDDVCDAVPIEIASRHFRRATDHEGRARGWPEPVRSGEQDGDSVADDDDDVSTTVAIHIVADGHPWLCGQARREASEYGPTIRHDKQAVVAMARHEDLDTTVTRDVRGTEP